MSTTQRGKEVSDESVKGRRDIPGAYLGIDGAGWLHYYQSGSRTVTVVDGDERKSFRIPDEKGLIDWGLEMIDEHEAAWEDIALDPPKCYWLQGDCKVGEWPDDMEVDA